MSSYVSFGQVTSSVRLRGDYALPAGLSYDSDSISTGLLLDFGRSAYRECYDMMATADVDRFLTSSAVSGSDPSQPDLYGLPGDFYRLRGVDASVAQGQEWFRLEPYGFAERDAYRTTHFQAAIPRYHLEGNGIRFAPTPQGIPQIRLWYVPVAVTIAGNDTPLDFVDGWEETMVQTMLIRCKLAQRQDVSDDRVELARQTQRLLQNSRDRDRGSPKRAIDPRMVPSGRSGRRRRF